MNRIVFCPFYKFQKAFSTMATSPELAAGLGFTFEDVVTAVYLSALLRESSAPGSNGHIIKRVAQQQKDYGEPLDDVIVDFQAPNGEVSRLSLQVKRALTVSSATTNSDFRAVVRDAYAAVAGTGFTENRDWVGTVTGTISDTRKRELETTCEWARASLSAANFQTKIAIEVHASDAQRVIVRCFRDILSEIEGIADLDEAVFRVLRHFILMRFDALHEGATTDAREIDALRSCLHVDDSKKAADLWARLRLIAREGGGRATEYDRASLVCKLRGGFRFVGAPSLRANLQQITDEARQALQTIKDEIDGFPLARTALVNEADAKSMQHRFVQIVGLPGVGKSVILRRMAERALEKGPILLLKSDRLEGNTWASYASALGLTPCPLRIMLAEICHTGTALLFIDGLDRIASSQRGIILDLLNALNNDAQLLQQWRIIATVRDNGIELLRNWLPSSMFDAGNMGLVTVESLNSEEISVLVTAKPALQHILTAAKAASEIARRPFFIAELVRLFPTADNNASLPRTETELIETWWRHGGLSGDDARIGSKQACLINLANKYGQCMGRPIPITGLDPAALLYLKNDGVIRDVRNGHTIAFCHDIFFEWSLFHALLDQGDQWLNGLRTMGEAPAFGRIVELLSQDCYFTDGEWAQQLAQLETAGLRSQWTRAWLTAPICSPLFRDASTVFTNTVLQSDSNRVKRLAVWFQAEKIQPNPKILTGKLFADRPRYQRIRLADEYAWPSDFSAWGNCCNWLLQHLPKCDVSVIPDILTVFEVLQTALQGVENDASQQIVVQAHAWLIDIEDRYHPENFADRDHGKWAALEGRDAVTELEKRLRVIFLHAATTAKVEVCAYLQRVMARPSLLETIYSQIVKFSVVLATIAPVDLANLACARYLDTLPDDILPRRARNRASNQNDIDDEDAANPLFQEIGYGNTFSYHDWANLAISDDYTSDASPLQEPFAALFAAAPNEARRLVRDLSNHAICAWRQLNALEPDRGRTPIPLELNFPWGQQAFWGDEHEYLWFRGVWVPTVLKSGLMALEAWAFAQLENGSAVDQVIKEIVQGHDCCTVLGVASALALSQMHLSNASLPLATCQQLWSWDIPRVVGEYTSHSNMVSFSFSNTSHKDPAAAVRAGNARACRKIDIRQLAFGFVAHPDVLLREAAKTAIRAFPQNLPFRNEEQKQDAAYVSTLHDTAVNWAEIGRGENYSLAPTADKDCFQIIFDNPKLKEPPAVARQREHDDTGSRIGLLMWANGCLAKQVLNPGYTVSAALEQARALDTPSFADMADGDMPVLGSPEEIIAAVAATVICHANNLSNAERNWAENVLFRAIAAPDAYGEWADAQMIIPFNPKISAVKGLAACIVQDVRVLEAQKALLQAITNPSKEVSAAAIKAGLGLWDTQPDFAWLVLDLAIRVSIGHRPQPEQISVLGYGHGSNISYLAQSASLAERWLDSPALWDKQLATLPQPWGEMYEMPNIDHIINPRFGTGRKKKHLLEPDPFLRWDFLHHVLTAIPVSKLMQSVQHRPELLRLCTQLIMWTGERLHPSCLAGLPPNEQPKMERANLIIWNDHLFRFLARVALELDLGDADQIILQPLNRLTEETQASLLEPFIRELSCAVMDSPALNINVIALLKKCVHRLMAFKDWHYARVRDGQLHGWHWSVIIKSICFIQVEHAKLAARFANGDWQEIGLLLPVFDPMIKIGGDNALVTDAFLTLCERAIAHYPIRNFIEQVNALLMLQQGIPVGWRGTSLMSRLATLIQLFAERSLPLEPAIAQAMLAILDRLVDMGNRRAAALQGSDSFRSIRIDRTGGI
jgi:hypothetical protein